MVAVLSDAKKARPFVSGIPEKNYQELFKAFIKPFEARQRSVKIKI